MCLRSCDVIGDGCIRRGCIQGDAILLSMIVVRSYILFSFPFLLSRWWDYRKTDGWRVCGFGCWRIPFELNKCRQMGGVRFEFFFFSLIVDWKQMLCEWNQIWILDTRFLCFFIKKYVGFCVMATGWGMWCEICMAWPQAGVRIVTFRKSMNGFFFDYRMRISSDHARNTNFRTSNLRKHYFFSICSLRQCIIAVRISI